MNSRKKAQKAQKNRKADGTLQESGIIISLPSFFAFFAPFRGYFQLTPSHDYITSQHPFYSLDVDRRPVCTG
jgi:hypothetical protein